MYASRFNPAGYNPAALMDTDLTGHCTYQSKWFQSNASLTWDIPWLRDFLLAECIVMTILLIMMMNIVKHIIFMIHQGMPLERCTNGSS